MTHLADDREPPAATGTDVGRARLRRTAMVLAWTAAGMWFAWLGWDHEYYEVNGVAQGPYRAWQVIGCGLAVAYVRVPRTIAIFVLAGAAVTEFAVPWAVDAARHDETGLWGAGLILLLAGGGTGLVLLLAAVDAFVGPGRSPTHALLVWGGLTFVTLFVFPPAVIVPLLLSAWVFFRRWLPERRQMKPDAAGEVTW